MLKKEEIRIGRLLLRGLLSEDRDEVIRIAKDPRVTATYMIPDLPDRDTEDRLFAALCRASEAEDRFFYVALDGGETVGWINDCGGEGKTVEIGYVVDPERRGRGYATEMFRAVIGEAFRIGFEEVKAGYFAENPASARVMEKCGLSFTGETRSEEYRGVLHETRMCSIRKEEALSAGNGGPTNTENKEKTMEETKKLEDLIIDKDGDGIADVTMQDTDGDGKLDTTLIDENDDGKVDRVIMDLDGDGLADVEVTYIDDVEGLLPEE